MLDINDTQLNLTDQQIDEFVEAAFYKNALSKADKKMFGYIITEYKKLRRFASDELKLAISTGSDYTRNLRVWKNFTGWFGVDFDARVSATDCRIKLPEGATEDCDFFLEGLIQQKGESFDYTIVDGFIVPVIPEELTAESRVYLQWLVAKE